MEGLFGDLLAALGVVVNGLPQGLLALSFGFAARPTAIGFAVGALGALLLGVVAPISFQAETITLVARMGENRQERISIVVLAGIAMTVIGIFGLLETIVDFIGPAINNGMMAGVGIILAMVATNMVRSNPLVGASSMVTAYLIQAVTGNLVHTIVVSVAVATLMALVRGYKGQEVDPGSEVIKVQPIVIKNPRVIRGTLSLIMLTIGANIAFGGITGSIAATRVNIDHLTVISGLADTASALFGGGPVEAIISATGAAPNPLRAGVLMMSLMAILLLAGLLPKLARFVPSETIAGFLFVLGAVITFPHHIQLAVEAGAVVGGVTAVATAATDPFTGMLVGLVTRFLLAAGGAL